MPLLFFSYLVSRISPFFTMRDMIYGDALHTFLQTNEKESIQLFQLKRAHVKLKDWFIQLTLSTIHSIFFCTNIILHVCSFK